MTRLGTERIKRIKLSACVYLYWALIIVIPRIVTYRYIIFELQSFAAISSRSLRSPVVRFDHQACAGFASRFRRRQKDCTMIISPSQRMADESLSG